MRTSKGFGGPQPCEYIQRRFAVHPPGSATAAQSVRGSDSVEDADLRCRVLPRFQIPAVEVADRDRGETKTGGHDTGRVEVREHLGDGGLMDDDICTGLIRGDRVDRIHPVSDLTVIERGVLTQ